MKRLLIILLCAMLSVSTSASAQQHPKLVPVRFMLQWLPQAQFAGYYTARQQGYYRQHGIDITIVPGGPDKIVSQALEAETVDFGMMFLCAALERRATGVAIVNVGQIMQHSALMLVARTNNGINSVADLNGKKVSLWANEFQIPPRMLFNHLGIDVKIIPQANSLALFLHRAVSATSAMWYNEYHTLLLSGFRPDELQPFFMRDTPYDFPEDGIYCLQQTIDRYPELAGQFLAATVQGWQYAFAHEEETLDLIAHQMEAASVPVNRVHQRWMLHRMRDLLLSNNNFSLHQCVLKEETFKRIETYLIASGIINKQVDYSTFYHGPAQ